jgi:hypothetical protein
MNKYLHQNYIHDNYYFKGYTVSGKLVNETKTKLYSKTNFYIFKKLIT